jgi:cysteine-rich repeat protein
MQKRRVITLFTSAGLFLGSGAVWAAQTPDHLQEYQGLNAAFGDEVRTQRRTSWTVPQAASRGWNTFIQVHGTKWRALWDTDTSIPLRIYGQGIAFDEVNESSAKAEQAARQILIMHLSLLAPGSKPQDFRLVSNEADRGIRSVGFLQTYQGKDVVGGQISMRFKNNRMIVLASTSLPNPAIEYKTIKTTKEAAIQSALTWIEKDFGSHTQLLSVEAEVILPLIRKAQQIEYYHVLPIVIDAQKPIGRWRIFIDRRTGERIAREQTLMFQTGPSSSSAEIKYNAPERYPGATRIDRPASHASILVDGVAISTDQDGILSWADTSSITARAHVIGQRVRVINDQGNEVTMDAVLAPGGEMIMDRRDDEAEDAQITTFISVGIAKDKVRSFAPRMAYLDEQLQATVNMDGNCNAFSDGTTINFFAASRRCENTGRLADVVYHEFGHAVHAHAVIRGVGEFDRSLSEGAADFLAAIITGDSGMGRGFFYSNRALRELDPSDGEARWPEDIDEDVHVTGLIFAGALWDLRKSLIDTLGEEAGQTKIEALYYEAMRRSTDIPSSYAEVLAADDDDGDLSNGTPNFCEITDAFAAHGLADPQTAGIGFDIPQLDRFNVLVPVNSGVDCPSSKIESATLNWHLRQDENIRGEIVMNQGSNGLEALIPEQKAPSVINFKITVTLGNGERVYFPRNPASDMYETFVGQVLPLYCTDFEIDPEYDNWSHELVSGDSNREGADDWHWDSPAGVQGSGDPARAFSGSKVIGNDLGGERNGQNYNGTYQGNVTNMMLSPVINTQGHKNIRLQYRRWLNVEDGYFDRATIVANEQEAWHNLDTGNDGDTHHTDKEWRFHDVDLSSFVANDQVQVGFKLGSDRGLNMGGWTIDDFCVVAYLEPVCGDGNVDAGEICDDGNEVDNDLCSNSCNPNGPGVLCGNGTLDEGEVCDWAISADECTKECKTPLAQQNAGAAVPGLERAAQTGCGCQIDQQHNNPAKSAFVLFFLLSVIWLRKETSPSKAKNR